MSDATPPLTALVVSRGPNCYLLADPALVPMIGADAARALPLPFTLAARPNAVVAHVRRISPGRSVRFDEDPPSREVPPCS